VPGANETIVRGMLSALSRGDAAGFLAPFADDVAFRIVGTTRFSGAYAGKGEVVARLLEPLGRLLDGGIAIEVEGVVADGEWVATRSRGRARTKAGRPYENEYAHFWRLRGGRVVEVHEYMDTALVDEVLGRS
jgi:ketosteroid isomerase-like protein